MVPKCAKWCMSNCFCTRTSCNPEICKILRLLVTVLLVLVYSSILKWTTGMLEQFQRVSMEPLLVHIYCHKICLFDWGPINSVETCKAIACIFLFKMTLWLDTLVCCAIDVKSESCEIPTGLKQCVLNTRWLDFCMTHLNSLSTVRTHVACFGCYGLW